MLVGGPLAEVSILILLSPNIYLGGRDPMVFIRHVSAQRGKGIEKERNS